MATRPVFVPVTAGDRLVSETQIEFAWNSGFAPSQKKKNVVALHNQAAQIGLTPILEVSTKSDEELGQRLSAFNLQVEFSDLRIPFESAYQGSKVFRNGGPFTDLYELAAFEAKKDPRLRNSGPLMSFDFYGVKFPLTPKTAFYDWLYLHSLYRNRNFWRQRLPIYAGFTDIEFNPEKSINCQARTCAMFVSLEAKEQLDESIDSFDTFVHLLVKAENAQSQISKRIA